MSTQIKSFVSEKQLDEKRKERQEEWERVRKPEDPVEAPEEKYDCRSLYERLEEQKEKKQFEFDEKLKFKNQFRGIDQDESDFLQRVNTRTNELEKEKALEEQKLLEEFRNSVSHSRELPEKDVKRDPESSESTQRRQSKKNVQSSILKTAVKRKSVPSEKEADGPPMKTKLNTRESCTVVMPSATKCVGVRPSLVAYGNNSESEDSSSDESFSNDLLSAIVRTG